MLRDIGADVPMPYAKNLEHLAIPSPERVIEAVRRVMYLE
jgi:pyruvate dehydrogenase E1 component beta subunit